MRPDDSGAGGGAEEGLFTPPPGSPGQVRAAASTLSGQAAAISGLAGRARSAQNSVIAQGHWTGPAASSFTTFAGRSETLCAGVEAPLTSVAKAAGSYADALQTAQSKIKDAKARYDEAQHRASSIAAAANSDPNATPADISAAQGKVNQANSDADAAVADARAAWTAYNSACQRVASEASDATGEVSDEVSDSPIRKVVEGSEPYREWNDKFHSVWDLVVADKALEALVNASKNNLTALTDVAKGIANDRTLWSSELSALDRLAEIGRGTPANAERAAALAQRLDALEAFGGDAAGQARNAGALFSGLRALSKGIGVTAVLGDALTVLDPPDKGAMGWVDRGAAGVNGALVTANLFTDEIPVVGEVTIAATGMYLAGNYLYHHWGAFHDACNAVGHASVDAAKWVGNTASDLGHDVASTASDLGHDVSNVASSAGHEVKNLASSGWHAVSSIF